MSFEFPFILIGKSTMAFFKEAQNGAFSNPGTEVVDFGAVLQTDLTRYSFVRGAG